MTEKKQGKNGEKTGKRSGKAKSPLLPPASPSSTHAGFVAILGSPNAGKSTLLNKFIGQKISITSPKAQTTRIRTLGILTEGQTQISFVDTPGIFAAKSRLDRAMVKAAWESTQDADAVILLIDASKRIDEKVEAIIEEFKKRKASIILALNKVDDMTRDQLLPVASKLNETGIFSDIFMISARTGDGVEDLKEFLKKKMPEGPWFFGEDQISDLPSQILAAEMTREQLYRQLQEELPYAAAVLPESLEEKRDGSMVIHQRIVVARENHRAIVLGKGGARIKSIGEKARADIGKLFDRKVHLFLTVKADEKWQDRPDFYRTFGLEFGK
ncbi:MAG: GTPase Era [Alphaproteobacteria bacterium]|nr:GTPase Era [Alphaproteobacteria bacterium]